MWQIDIFIAALKKYNEKIQIDIIGQKIVEEELRKNKNINNLYFYDNGFFEYDLFLKNEQLSSLKDKYAYCALLCNNTTGYGYDEVIKIAKYLSPEILKVLNDGNIKIIF